MLPSIREILAFGDAGSSGEARLGQETLQLPQPVFKSPEHSLIETPDTAPTTDEQPFSSLEDSSKQRPGRKAGPQTRYTASPGARQYRCGVHSCAALFKRPEHLKRHMLTHTQARPFECKARGCGKRFSRRDNFLTHAKKHGTDDSSPLSAASSPVGGASGTASSDDEFLEDQMESASLCGHKRAYSDMASHDNAAVADSSSGDGGPSVLNSRVSSIFGLLNSNDDADIPLSVPFSLPPLELLAYASSAQSGSPSILPPKAASLPQQQQQKQKRHDGGKGEETLLLPFPKKSRQNRTSNEGRKARVAAIATAETSVTDVNDPSKPFKCSSCNSHFGRLEHVKRHQLVHTGKRQFGCPTCNKMFARKDNMIQHLRAHERKQGAGAFAPATT
ncbi:hypothetical protein EV175_001621 [Coemansia sp. RSA 1933]|nr:hypothetical protein EV175_001621 [Coemansia sp. RSA 1933]